MLQVLPAYNFRILIDTYMHHIYGAGSMLDQMLRTSRQRRATAQVGLSGGHFQTPHPPSLMICADYTTVGTAEIPSSTRR